MKYVKINGKLFSKLICGTNAFYGRSHFSTARDKEYGDRCSDLTIRQILEKCLASGVNAVESSANERIYRIVTDLRMSHAQPLHFIGSTRIDRTSAMKSHREKLDFLIENRADICVIHSQFVDRPRSGAEIRGLRSLVEKIHAAHMIAGISTHRVSTVEHCEAKDYGIDVYLFPLNLTGFVYPEYDGNESVADRVDLVLGTPKPFILMKTLAAGRIPPDEGLPFAMENSKDTDIITLGLSSIEEAEESLAILKSCLGKDA